MTIIMTVVTQPLQRWIREERGQKGNIRLTREKGDW